MLQKFLILSIFLTISQACVDMCRGRSDNHFAVNPRGCAWYFRCNVGLDAEEGKCPDNFKFNYEKQSCDYAEFVDCDNDRNFPTECPAVGVAVIQHPNVCSKFVVCIDGNEEDRDCPNGLHFSNFDGKCVEPRFAECETDRGFCVNSNNGDLTFNQFKVANSRACDQFYLCWNNKEDDIIGAATFRCDTGLHVNPNTFSCELPGDAGCDASEHPQPLESPGVNIDFNCTSDGIFAHPDSCKFWFFCQSGQSHIFQCSPATTFDADLKRCVWGVCAAKETESEILTSNEELQANIIKSNERIEKQQRELLERVLGKRSA